MSAAPASGRRRAFRIVAGILGGLALVLAIPFTVIAFFDDAESVHRMHYLSATALYGPLLGVALLVSARRPEENGSAFLVAVGSGVATTVGGLVSGDFISGVAFPAPISIAILWWLHPDRSSLLRRPGVDRPTVTLSVLALVPAIAFALTQAELQRNGLSGDPHWELHHYSGMTAAALALPLCGLAASVRRTGRALASWLVAIAAVLVGGGSLLLPDHLGAFEPMWAWLTLAWAVAIVAATRVRVREGVRTSRSNALP